MDMRLRRTVAQVHDDQISIPIVAPVPGNYILIARIVGPASALAQLPLPLAKHRSVDGLKQFPIEILQFLVDGLFWPSTQEHGQPNPAALELSFVEEPCAGQSGRRYRRRSLFRSRETLRRTRLVVVLNEAQKLVLINRFSRKMEADTFCVVMLEPIIESFVVTEVKALLLQLPLEIPISLGNEAEVGMRLLDGGNYVNPVFCRRSGSSAFAPGAFKDRVQQQHSHVATYAIGLAGNVG